MDTKQYITEVIGKGDEGSGVLNAMLAPTLEYQDIVDIIQSKTESFPVLRTPENYDVVVCSAAGDNVKSLDEHAYSMVRNLENNMKEVGAEPVALANVVDSETGDLDMIKIIGQAIAQGCYDTNMANMNGENAILGSRVQSDANVMGTAIGLVKSGKLPKNFEHNNLNYSTFTPEKAVWINSDGIGTKSEFYERIGKFERGLLDWLAMLADDTIKKGAIAKVASGILETRNTIPAEKMDAKAQELSDLLGFNVMFDRERVPNRIMGYKPGAPSYNLSGSIVSEIDEEWLRNPPTPKLGEYLMAVASLIPNPRSNGITDKRKTMEEIFGREYHKTKEGRMFLEYLAQPSTVLYPLFQELLNNGLASSVYHMSGGSFNGKLGKPLAKDNLFCSLRHIYKPDWRESAIIGWNFTSPEDAYAKYPMSNDGFFTTNNPKRAAEIVQKYGLKCMGSGILEKGSGVELPVKGSDGKKIQYLH
ncbi:MAG: hypothetical protein ACOCZ6_02645 [Nanoarchaeota archaeon]